MGPIVRLVAQGIGIAKEGIAARRKGRGEAQDQDPNGNVREILDENNHATPPGAGGYGVDSERGQNHQDPSGESQYQEDYNLQANILNLDEQEWYLDEYSDDVGSCSYSITTAITNDELVKQYDKGNDAVAQRRLECPVIIPQRRPRSKACGFVRAYAPMLGNCGVDQDTFLRFIKDFHRSSQANPWFDVINVAAFAAGFVPSVTAIVVSAIVQTAAQTSKEIQGRHRANAFLDKMNDQYFRPRGLYCMLITYKPLKAPKQNAATTEMDITKSITPQDSTFKNTMKSIRNTSGETRGGFEIPKAAPLIFPSIDRAADGENGTTSLKKSEFFNDYLDRRAQAKFAHENPDSALSVPQTPKFGSRYSDPNHPASNGSLISLLTGGHVNPYAAVDHLRQKYRDHSREKANKEATEKAGDGVAREVVAKTRVGQRSSLLARLLREDIIYMTIVNMPSEQELEDARQQLELEKTSHDSEARKEGAAQIANLPSAVIRAAV